MVQSLRPGWPYLFVTTLESGRTSRRQILDARRLGPADDVAEVSEAQVRHVPTTPNWPSSPWSRTDTLRSTFEPASSESTTRVLASSRSAESGDPGKDRLGPQEYRPVDHLPSM